MCVSLGNICEWAVSCFGYKKNPGNRWIGCWVDPRVVLEAEVEKGKISALLDKNASF